MNPLTPMNLTEQQKTDAAIVLRGFYWWFFGEPKDIDDLQDRLAKVGLAIQPIPQKETTTKNP